MSPANSGRSRGAFDLRRLRPVDPDGGEEAEPPQKVHPIRALRRRRTGTRGEIGEVRRGSRDRHTRGVEEAVGLEEVSRRLERSDLGHRQFAKIDRPINVVKHGSTR